MPTIMISILPDGMPVDTMEESDEGSSCPLPTQDADINMENMDMAEYYRVMEQMNS